MPIDDELYIYSCNIGSWLSSWTVQDPGGVQHHAVHRTQGARHGNAGDVEGATGK